MSNEEKQLVTYCGLYCPDCYAYSGQIASLAQELRELLDKYNFAMVAETVPFEGFQYYKEGDAFLEALTYMRCQKTCRGGGGNPACPIRECCQEKGVEGCWECDQFEQCETIRILEPVHKDANIKNLRNIKKEGTDNWPKKRRYW